MLLLPLNSDGRLSNYIQRFNLCPFVLLLEIELKIDTKKTHSLYGIEKNQERRYKKQCRASHFQKRKLSKKHLMSHFISCPPALYKYNAIFVSLT